MSIRKIYPHAFGLLLASLAACELQAQAQERPANVSNARRQKKPVAAAQPTDANGWYEQAQRHAGRGNLELAIAAYETFLRQADIQKDAQARLAALREQLERRNLGEKLERRYADAKAAMTARDWTRAVVELATIAQHDANFRDVAKRLAEAQNQLANGNSGSAVVRLYALGLAAMTWNELDEAHAALHAVLRFDPDYRDTKLRLQALESMRARAASQPAPVMPVDSLYNMAQRAAARSDWPQAVIALEALRLVQPEYRDALERLAEARTALALTQTPAAESAVASAPENFSWPYLGGLAALLVLPALGWLYLSPDVRAKRLLARHDFRAAAKLYEGLLARHPSRVKYFSKLAEIYLQEGRKDDEAMKVYRNVLQLNLVAAHREEINTMVAQQYLQEGRTDSDAIEVLEKQLEAEMQRQSRALVKAG